MADRNPTDWRNVPAHTQWLAVAAVLGIVGGLFLLNWFSGAAARAVGPTLVATNHIGETLLASSGTLYLVDAEQADATIIRAGELGLRGPVMSVSSDGTHWFIGDDASGTVHRCDPGARLCTAALKPRERQRVFRRAHKVAFTNDQVFLTDSEAHEIAVFDRDGRETRRTRTGPLELCFPNGIVAVDDSLYVADTNNFRIARILAEDPVRSVTLLHVNAGPPPERANCIARSGRTGERGNAVANLALDSANTVADKARPPARADRVWPASVLRTSTGEWWVVQMANRMRDGDVIRYDDTGKALGRVRLPADADPIDLVESRGEVLITDAGVNRVHRVSLQGKVLGEWGPDTFRSALRGIDAERKRARVLENVSYQVLAIGVLLALLVVVLEMKRLRKRGWSAWTRAIPLGPVDIQPSPFGTGTTWLSIDGALLRRRLRNAWLFGAWMLLLLGALAWFLGTSGFGKTPLQLQIVSIGIVAASLLLVGGTLFVEVRRMRHLRLGVSSPGVEFDPGTGKIEYAPWSDVRAGGRFLLLGSRVVPIIDQLGRYIYPQDRIEAELLSRLPRPAFIGPARLILEAMRRGNVSLWLTALGTLAYVAVLLLGIFNKELLRGLATRLHQLLF